MRLKDEGHEVVMHIVDHHCKKIGEGIVDKDEAWWNYAGKNWIFVFDGCAHGSLQDYLREKGELVFGGTQDGDELENDRQLGQKLFKAAGFRQPVSKNFKDFASALQFVKSIKNKRWILKQNGNAPKSLNHMGKFDDGSDMIFHLEEMNKMWHEPEFGKVDFDLMEVVEGTEMAASAWFNGHDFMRNKDGKVVGFINYEEKKELAGGLGETTGEMGTTFIGVTEDDPLFKEIMMKPKIKEVLAAMEYKGVFDINCIKTKQGMVALEPTCRFGVPATSYEFMEGLITPASELIAAVAKGENMPVEIHLGIGMVMVIAAKPFPLEHDGFDSTLTSLGERLWILENGKPADDLTSEQKKHIHLENFEKKDGYYCVASKNGYLLTVTGRGKTIFECREALIEYIKDSIYISGMKYRTDIGKRVEEAAGISSDKERENLRAVYEKKLKEKEEEYNERLAMVKDSIRQVIYE